MSDAAQASDQHIGEQLLAVCEHIKAVVEEHLGSDYKVTAVRGDLAVQYHLIP